MPLSPPPPVTHAAPPRVADPVHCRTRHRYLGGGCGGQPINSLRQALRHFQGRCRWFYLSSLCRLSASSCVTHNGHLHRASRRQPLNIMMIPIKISGWRLSSSMVREMLNLVVIKRVSKSCSPHSNPVHRSRVPSLKIWHLLRLCP